MPTPIDLSRGHVVPMRPTLPIDDAERRRAERDEEEDLEQAADSANTPVQPAWWKRVPTEQWLELPLIFQHHWLTWPAVDQAISALEYGWFQQASLLWDAMLMDDRISGCIETRVDALLSNEVKLRTPGLKEGEEATGLQAECNAKILELWETMVPRATASSVIRWGLGPGIAPTENVWDRGEGLWVPQMKVWHPQNLYWRADTKSYWLITWKGTIELKPGNGQWGIFAPYRNHYGYVEPTLLRSLNRVWLQRLYGWRDLARWSEVYALGVKRLYVPQSAQGTPDKTTAVRHAKNLASESVMELPRPDDGKGGFDLDMMPTNDGTGVMGIIEQIKECDSSIAIRILGQNLTTEMKSGGSLAAAKVHQTTMQRGRIASDNVKFCSFVRDTLLKPFVLYNYGTSVVVPIPYYEIDPPEDKKDETEALKNVAQAIAALLAAPVATPIDIRALAEKYDLPVVGEDLGDEAPVDETLIPPTRDPEITGTKGGFRKRVPQSHRHGQSYADQLADSSTRLASKMLSGKLGRLFAAVSQSESYDDLRRHLKQLYQHASPKELDELYTQAISLASMAGIKAARDHHQESR